MEAWLVGGRSGSGSGVVVYEAIDRIESFGIAPTKICTRRRLS